MHISCLPMDRNWPIVIYFLLINIGYCFMAEAAAAGNAHEFEGELRM